VRKLERRSASGRVAGVCSGIAEYLDTDVTLVRLAWVVLSIVPGSIIGGLVAYLAAWLVMPDADKLASPSDRSSRKWLTRSTTDRKFAGVCGGLGDYFEIDSTVVRVVWVILGIVPGCFILGLLAYLVAWFIIPERSTSTSQVAPSAA
jgi:phage shock protein PspC (stress-responsive transcriptional regulator)